MHQEIPSNYRNGSVKCTASSRKYWSYELFVHNFVDKLVANIYFVRNSFTTKCGYCG